MQVNLTENLRSALGNASGKGYVMFGEGEIMFAFADVSGRCGKKASYSIFVPVLATPDQVARIHAFVVRVGDLATREAVAAALLSQGGIVAGMPCWARLAGQGWQDIKGLMQ